jgi:hypothetical protein
MSVEVTPLFEPEGSSWHPTPFSRGPWDPGLLHGGAVGALAAELLQDRLEGYQPVRLVVNLLRPVPLGRLTVNADVVRQGTRLGLAELQISALDRLVATASLLGMTSVELEAPVVGESRPAPDDGWRQAADSWSLDPEKEAFIGGALSFRFQAAGGASGGTWLCLHRPVIPGRAPSGLARVAAAADVPSAGSAFDGARLEGVGFINADATCHLSRVPDGEWIRLEAWSRWELSGIGTVAARVFDEDGPVGHIGQALVLARGLTPP